MPVRLAISNIAWTPSEDDAIAEVMRRERIDAVEIAPTLYWKEPLAATPEELDAVREAWSRRGFPIAALQSLIFGQGHLQLLSKDTSEQLASRLEGIIRIAERLGAGVLVFGSPKNRWRGGLTLEAAAERAVPFFRRIGDYAAKHGVVLCIEPNPPQYGCDFVTTAAEGRELVARVGSHGFGLHLDMAGMHLAGDDPAAELAESLPSLRHVHISAPHLAAVSPGVIDYAKAIHALRIGSYEGFVSVEMRPSFDEPSRVRQVVETLRFVRSLIRPDGSGEPA